ncbi:ATP-binding cassette domain-containing protein [Maritalea myrionectae]|uniref:ATP-binding cassette domain-containing protein n=1 Tax=Maritalea myrionectae TaxID=454601 RepID=UPI00040AE136|nr:ATP-binding cassette domain-containing protein [Maritalea myrionectae]
MQRIAILGGSGSGKSTLARALGKKLNLPVVHMDQHYFSAGWVEPDHAHWREKVAAMCAEDRWVMDGNYSKTFDLRLPRADLIIFLDFPTWLCTWRVFKRTTFGFGKVRPDSAVGCPERFDPQFLLYVLNYRRQRAPKIREKLIELGTSTRILSSPNDINEFLEELTI